MSDGRVKIIVPVATWKSPNRWRAMKTRCQHCRRTIKRTMASTAVCRYSSWATMGGADQWFGFVENIERADPTLEPTRVRQLEKARRELADMLRLQQGVVAPNSTQPAR